MFSFQDEDEQWVSLRYDLTAPLARYVAGNFDALPKPFRRYQSGYVYRNEKPGPGRFRQFMQFDADTVGTANPAADAEMCMLAADTLEALGIPRDSMSSRYRSRNLLDAVLDASARALPSTQAAPRVLRAVDKLDRLGLAGRGRSFWARAGRTKSGRLHARSESITPFWRYRGQCMILALLSLGSGAGRRSALAADHR